MKILFVAVVLAGLCMFSCGCVYRVAYNPRYVPTASFAVQPVAQGKGLLYMDPSDESFVYRGRPSSFTGGGSTLEIPMGSIAREISTRRFGKLFGGGYDVSTDRAKMRDHAVTIQTRVVDFGYKYNRLRNLDFATTPQIDLTLQVSASDQSGNMFFSKTYGTGTFSGKTVLDTMKPAELINRIAHEATSQLLEQAASELEVAMKVRQQSALPSQAPAVAAPAAAPTQAGKQRADGESSEERLRKLKALHDQGLISKEVYEKKQQEIMSSY